MGNLFRKAAVLTDIHLGLKSNSQQHNEDCLRFIKWTIEKAKAENCDTLIACGDWHNHRSSINIQTLHYSMMCLELLNENFDHVWFITGNHDLFYREKREVHSVGWAKYLPNVEVINEITTVDDVTFCPWLVGDEHTQIKKIKTKYTFGHFELPNFYMNAQIMMPDHGIFKAGDFSGTEQVFSGHFHKRQHSKNITYIGNAFPHNYSDAGDDDRGIMILEWGQDPKYFAWPDQPKYRVALLSDVLDRPEMLIPNAHFRVHLDVEISYEEANFIKETLIPKHSLREMALMPIRSEAVTDDAKPDLKFESVDQIVMDVLDTIDSQQYDKKLLMEIYSAL